MSNLETRGGKEGVVLFGSEEEDRGSFIRTVFQHGQLHTLLRV